MRRSASRRRGISADERARDGGVDGASGERRDDERGQARGRRTFAACVEVETRARVRSPVSVRGCELVGRRNRARAGPKPDESTWPPRAKVPTTQRAFKSTRAMTTYLWLDCDPGHDDAMAIILAAHGMNPNVIVAGVSTTCGNQTLEKTTDNALRILHLIGRDDVGARPATPSSREHTTHHRSRASRRAFHPEPTPFSPLRSFPPPPASQRCTPARTSP